MESSAPEPSIPIAIPTTATGETIRVFIYSSYILYHNF